MLEAVITLLGDRGFAGMSIDAVASLAGVSKATIYRHWPSKEALCGEAVACVVVEVVSAGEGDPRAQLALVLRRLTTSLERSDAGRLLPHLASAAETDPRLGQIWRQSLVYPVRQRVGLLLRQAADHGDLAPSTDVELATEILLAPLFYRRLVTGVRPGQGALVERLLDVVWATWPPP